VAVRKCNRDSRNHLISIAITCSLLPLRRMAAERHLTAAEGIAGHGFALQQIAARSGQSWVKARTPRQHSARQLSPAADMPVALLGPPCATWRLMHRSKQRLYSITLVPRQVSLQALVREPRGVDVDHQLGLGRLQKAQYGSPQERRRYVERPHVAFAPHP
jgi:hypothetical protein